MTPLVSKLICGGLLLAHHAFIFWLVRREPKGPAVSSD